MDDVTSYSRTVLPRRDGRRSSRDTAAWVGASLLSVFTVAALAPPAFFVWLLVRHSGTDWQVNHASHVTAAKAGMLIILAPMGGAALCGLATLLSRRLSVAERAMWMAGGAFLASLTLTAGGFVWMISHAQFTF